MELRAYMQRNDSPIAVLVTKMMRLRAVGGKIPIWLGNRKEAAE